MNIRIKKVRANAVLPEYQTPGAAGMDLHACIDAPVTMEPGKQVIIPTGIAVEIPEGYEGQVRGRSGLAAKHQIGVTNGLGTIDSDYRGELNVILVNLGNEPFVIEPNMRIAQLVIAKYERVDLELVHELTQTNRGENRFGSTGVKHG